MTTEAVAQPSTRTAFCPACGADLELHEEQLICKRAACAACGRTIEIVPELFGRPPRGQALVPVGAGVVEGPQQALALVDPPPSSRVNERDDGAIVLRSKFGVPALSGAEAALAGGFALSMAIFAFAGGLAVGLTFLLLLLATALPAVGFRGSRLATIRIDDDELTVARGPYGLLRDRIPLERVGDLTVARALLRDRISLDRFGTLRELVSTSLSIDRASDYPLVLGQRLRFSENELHWTQRRLTRAIRLARLRRARKGGRP